MHEQAAQAQSHYSMFKVGSWIAQPQSNKLVCGDSKVSIEPKMMDVLAFLCENAGHVVSTEQLLIACWKGTFYGDAPVQKCIAMLRKKLGCNARKPSYIETVHRRGYKIIAAVSFSQTSSQPYIIGPVAWDNGSPFLGLHTFQAEHAPIYFGRTKAIAEVIQQIHQCCKQGTHFLLLLGKSGIGKSSLIRAGVLPYLHNDLGFAGFHVSRYHIVMPRQGQGQSPTRMLVDALVELEMLKPTTDLTTLTEQLDQYPELLGAELAEEPDNADSLATESTGYKLLIIDQFEQFLLDEGLSIRAKANLVACMTQLAQRKQVFLIALLRNDFYANCVDIDGFTELKGDGRQYDLQPATPGEIAKMIRHPAYAAGLSFEIDEASGERLDDLLLDAAIHHPDALPLLEYTLDLLYQQRNNNQLLLSAYRDMGGVEGAIARQAELTYCRLPDASRRCWHKIMHTLVKVDLTNRHAITARKVPISAFASEAEQVFVQEFIKARLFVCEMRPVRLKGKREGNDSAGNGIEDDEISQSSKGEFISLAHEALLYHWQRVSDWVEENRTALHKRIQLASDCQRWREDEENRELLLPPGKQVADGLWLIQRPDIELYDYETRFVLLSQQRENNAKNVQRILWAVFVGLFIVVTSLAIIANQHSKMADQSRIKAEGLIDYMLGDLRDQLEPIGKLDVLHGVGKKTLEYYQGSIEGGLLQQANSLKLLAEINISKDQLGVAEQQLQQAMTLLDTDRAVQNSNDEKFLLLVGNLHYWLGLITYYKGDFDTTADHWKRYLSYAEQLLVMDLSNLNLRLEVGHANHNLGALARRQQNLLSARRYFSAALDAKQQILQADSDNPEYIETVISSLNWWADLEFSFGEINQALTGIAQSVSLSQQLIERQPDNYEFKYKYLVSSNVLLAMQLRANDWSAAADTIRKTTPVVNELVTHDPKNQMWRRQVSLFHIRQLEFNYFEKNNIDYNKLADLSDFFEQQNTQSNNKLRAQLLYLSIRLMVNESVMGNEISGDIFDLILHEKTAFILDATPRLVFELSRTNTNQTTKLINLLEAKLPPLSDLPDSPNQNIYVLVGHYILALLQQNSGQAESLLTQIHKRGYAHPFLTYSKDIVFVRNDQPEEKSHEQEATKNF